MTCGPSSPILGVSIYWKLLLVLWIAYVIMSTICHPLVICAIWTGTNLPFSNKSTLIVQSINPSINQLKFFTGTATKRPCFINQ
jgi:hypothetical protein